MRENNYTQELLDQVIRDEETILFDKFDNNDAIRFFNLFFTMAEEKGYNVCLQVKLGEFVVARGFGNGTDESNIPFINRKSASVVRSGKSSLRCGIEDELLGQREDWYDDKENILNRGGACPIRLKDGTLAGVFCVSGLWHVDDHIYGMEVLKKYWESVQ